MKKVTIGRFAKHADINVAAVVDSTGHVVAKHLRPTQAHRGPDDMLADIVAAVEGYLGGQGREEISSAAMPSSSAWGDQPAVKAAEGGVPK